MKPIGKIFSQREIENVIFLNLSKIFYRGVLDENYFSLYEKIARQ